MRRVLAALAATAVLTWPVPTWADGWGGAQKNPDGVDVDAGTREGSDSTDGSAEAPLCTYEPVTPGFPIVDSDLEEIVHDEAGGWYIRTCISEETGAIDARLIWIPQRDAADLVAQAKERLVLPAPAVRMSPGADRDQLVNLASWLWIEAGGWQPRSATASVPGITVTATARPLRAVWDMGNGDIVMCPGPGVAYDPAKPETDQATDCSYTWRKSSADQPDGRYVVKVTVEWGASWTASGAPGGGDLGVIPRASTVRVRVVEARAVNSREPS